MRRPVGRAFMLLLLVLPLLLTACRPPGDTANGNGNGSDGNTLRRTVEAKFVSEPKLGASQLEVTVTQGGEPVDDAIVEITGDMTHAGMAPVIATAEGAGDGRYLSNDFAFSMAGDWILTITVTYPDGVRVERHLAVAVPGN